MNSLLPPQVTFGHGIYYSNRKINQNNFDLLALASQVLGLKVKSPGLFYEVLGIESTTPCILGKHSTNLHCQPLASKFIVVLSQGLTVSLAGPGIHLYTIKLHRTDTEGLCHHTSDLT